ncbi:hypothetical protein F4V57_00655 [Acinetobacter qingfengensis]|uniref:Uncharacterized protein n=1 Tax=Acinetobacter qingfengensis TaxID=1262585 RepID=A0A1E7RD42_9GAMM|nr:hypothetical protein [Acinetobacter qingfengensis]KAA8735346.1 hypothetical protein F4V57_00655 [Acinetobacter qingfengensis]OEY97329.1 hypothetical protein BJI46_10620 [Acinetobacter qingfengensis]
MKISAISQLQQRIRRHGFSLTTYFDRYYLYLIGVMMGLFLIWSIHLFYRPITTQQQQQVVQYVTQSLYPNTRDYALFIVRQAEPINQYQYFRFLRMLQLEKQRIHYQKAETVSTPKSEKIIGSGSFANQP